MRFEVKSKLGDRTYTVYRTNDLDNAAAFAESFHRNNHYETTYVSRRGHIETVALDGKPCLWGKSFGKDTKPQMVHGID